MVSTQVGCWKSRAAMRYPSLTLLRRGRRRLGLALGGRRRAAHLVAAYGRADERIEHWEGLRSGWQNGECARKLQEIEGLAMLDATFKKAGCVASWP
jgi:hypothetical protein